MDHNAIARRLAALGREEAAAPGKWKVWREGDKVKHERTGLMERDTTDGPE